MVALTVTETAGQIGAMPSLTKVASGPTKIKMDLETIQTVLMVTSVPLRGEIHLKIDMVALIEITMAGPTPITGASGVLYGPLRTVPMHFGRTPLNGPTTTSTDMATTGPIQNGMILMKKWASVNL